MRTSQGLVLLSVFDGWGNIRTSFSDTYDEGTLGAFLNILGLRHCSVTFSTSVFFAVHRQSFAA